MEKILFHWRNCKQETKVMAVYGTYPISECTIHENPIKYTLFLIPQLYIKASPWTNNFSQDRTSWIV